MRWVYLVCGVTVTERVGLLGCFVAQTRGVMLYYLTSNSARVGDNVVFVREPRNPFDPSCVKVGLSQISFVYVFGHLEARVASIIYLLGTFF